IYDISDPSTTPVNGGGVDVSTDVKSVFVSGKYAYAGLVSVSGNDWRIFDVAGIDTPTLAVGAAGIGQLSVSDNARIDNDLYVNNAINVGLGGIQSDGAIVLQGTTTGNGATAVAGMLE